MRLALFLLCVVVVTQAFSPLRPEIRVQQTSNLQMSWKDMKLLKKALPIVLSGLLIASPSDLALMPIMPSYAASEEWVPPKYDDVAPWNSNIKYTVVKKGSGAKINVGVCCHSSYIGLIPSFPFFIPGSGRSSISRKL